MRFVLLLLAAGAVWLLARRFLTHPTSAPTHRERDDGESMVRCHACGLHVPQSAAFRGKSHWYCCQEHARDEGSR